MTLLQIHDTVTLVKSEQSDLDRMVEMRLNSQYCSYNDEIGRIQIPSRHCMISLLDPVFVA
jgi:hypothetical protein